MRSYLGIFKMEFKGELQYRAKAISGIATQFFWGILLISLYTAFMNTDEVNGFSISQMASYIWLGQAFFVMRYIYLLPNTSEQIVSGNVGYKFVRPIELYNQWFSEHLGQKMSATLLRSPIVIIISLLLPSTIGLSLPVSISAFLLFIISLIIGTLLSVAISMLAVYLVFKTLSNRGAVTLVSTISGLLGGIYIPIPLMPDFIQNIVNYLPFRYISDLPIRIYIGNVGISDALLHIGVCITWLVIIILLGKILIKASAKKAIIQGG